MELIKSLIMAMVLSMSMIASPPGGANIDMIKTALEEVPEVEHHKVWTSANLNIRELPLLTSNVVGIYDKGTELDVVYLDDDWALVTDTGYSVNRNYLSNTKINPYEEYVFKLTAYCPCSSCSEGWGRKTATGTTATEGRTIAVDPRIIPYGTKVMINGHTYIAEDCGGGVKGYHIDVYFDNHSKVNKFGRKQEKVIILED